MRPEENRSKKRPKQTTPKAKKCSHSSVEKINKRRNVSGVRFSPHHSSSTHQSRNGGGALHSSQFLPDRPTSRDPKFTESVVGTSDNGVRWGKDQRQRKGATKTKENPHNA
ncbi:hypothetical protein Pcinc_037774 [Petrolisthes cinctipes]|uniref:Uncharacterized protein n=1 Tax=Petrolisthes cinctipes TaxID=88211 RepID=A0AAE1ENM8_PETCI|nr:hypothetical protein Pcinc_037774 [Petrolisthes cinctipes]